MQDSPCRKCVMEKFFKVYEEQLREVVSNPANGYSYGVELVPTVVQKMRAAVLNGSYNKDGIALKRTCKILGIPYTYAGISSYVKNNP